MHTHKAKPPAKSDSTDSIEGPTEHEWAALAVMLDFDLEATLKTFDEKARREPARAPIETHSRHTTIRIPADVLNTFRHEANRRGIPYQTLIIETLRRAMKYFLEATPVK